MGKIPETSIIVEKALKIVDFLSKNRGPQSLKDICQSLELSTTIAHRLLTTLKNSNMVFQDHRSKLYSLGWVFLEYTNKLMAEVPISPIIEPWLLKLRDLTNETVGFYIPTGTTRICLLEAESKQQIRRTVGTGNKLPIHLGAGGKVILAFMREEEKEAILRMLSMDNNEMHDDLKLIANNGYCISEEETFTSVAALAAPVFDMHEHVIGALSISGPLMRWNRNSMQPYIADILHATKSIGEFFKSKPS